MEKNDAIENNTHSKTKRQKPIGNPDAKVLSDNYINFTENIFTKDRTVKRISLPIIELKRLLERWEGDYTTLTIAVGRTDERIGIVMLGAGDTSSTKEWVDCYDVFPETFVGKYGDGSGMLFCPPPAVCELPD